MTNSDFPGWQFDFRFGHFILPALIYLCLGCTLLPHSPPSKSELQRNADQLAARSGFLKELLPVGKFTLTTYRKILNTHSPLVVYIEGDGVAYAHRNLVSVDPTPLAPLVLELATLDPRPNILYLSRPCQYTTLLSEPHCHPDIWSRKRFSPDVFFALEKAIDGFLRPGQKIILIGYSGGATLAMGIAARRSGKKDVLGLVTLAGNLDHTSLHSFYKVDQLLEAPEPGVLAPLIASLPQHHYLGEKDQIIPLFVTENFLQKLYKDFSGGKNYSQCFTVLDGVDHYRGFQKNWFHLLQRPLVNCLQLPHSGEKS